MTKSIPLTKGKFALVDDVDFEWLNQWKWLVIEKAHGFYACRFARVGLKRQQVSMHRLILGLSHGDGIDCDHKNGDSLDNQRKNLRPATRSQNIANRGKTANNTSGYKGVTWLKIRKKWMSQIMVDGKKKTLGYFDDPIEAACAYDEAARKYFGEYAHPNF